MLELLKKKGKTAATITPNPCAETANEAKGVKPLHPMRFTLEPDPAMVSSTLIN